MSAMSCCCHSRQSDSSLISNRYWQIFPEPLLWYFFMTVRNSITRASSTRINNCFVLNRVKILTKTSTGFYFTWEMLVSPVDSGCFLLVICKIIFYMFSAQKIPITNTAIRPNRKPERIRLFLFLISPISWTGLLSSFDWFASSTKSSVFSYQSLFTSTSFYRRRRCIPLVG